MTAPVSNPSSDPETEEQRRTHDRLIEYLKHLTTLSTGTIVLQIAFLEKLFPHPRWKALIVVSLMSLSVSVLGSVAAYTMLLGQTPTELSERQTEILAGLMVSVWAGFLLGILILGVFGVKNLLLL